MTIIDDVLDGLRLDSSVFCRMSLSGDWGFAKAALSGVFPVSTYGPGLRL